MTGEGPDGARLLNQARVLLTEALIEPLAAGQRYQARLVANAMAIAARELAAGRGPLMTQVADLAKLFGEVPNAGVEDGPGETLEEARERLTWRLSSEIRGGMRDRDPLVHALLEASARARLRLSNPKALKEEPDSH